MNEGLKRKLTLVAAPAGYGKTTLLSEWVRQADAATAWLSLDINDNDPARFLSYLVAALRKLEPSLGHAVLTTLKSPQIPPTEAVLTPLINDLMSLETHVLLVLDDYHLIEADGIHQALTFLLDHLPVQMHIVIATRADPRLPLGRLRAKGELVELREADLRFTSEETDLFLNQVMGLALSEDQITKLTSRTEGWIAGLQLAAISMQGREDISTFVDAFSGSHEYVVDYLTDEVLKGQPQDLQTFLLETSILDRMSGQLCEAVTGQQEGQATLERLRDAHLFVLSLDDERNWYRYHRLFADLLHKRLRQMQPEKVSGLYDRASTWFAEEGLMAEAIEYALRGEDFERSAKLIEQVAEETLFRSEVAMFLGWMERLPEPIVRAHPALGISHAFMLLTTGSPIEEVKSRLEGLNYERETFGALVAAVRAAIGLYQGQLAEAHEIAHHAIDMFPDEEGPARGIANWVIGLVEMASSSPAAGIRALEGVVEESRSGGNVMLATTTLCEIARLYTQQGRLHKAEEIYEQALDLAKNEVGKSLPIAGEALMGLGEVYREWNRLEEAEQYLREGVDLTKQWLGSTAYKGHISMARIRLAQGELDAAYDLIDEAKKLAISSETFPVDDLIVAFTEATVRVSQGDLGTAERWLMQRGWGADLAVPKVSGDVVHEHMYKYENLLQVRLLIARNQFDQALTALEPLHQRMKQGGRVDLCIMIKILKALALQAQGELTEAIAALEDALSLAKPGGYIRIFLDEGEAMARLLEEASSRGILTEYVGQLLAAISVSWTEGEHTFPTPLLSTEMVEPLSERELQVLRLLASPLTSTGIAEELYISVNTARFHIKNIYGKLGVHSRVEAVDRAKDLGLLT